MDFFITTILPFLFVFSVLVLAHELGHFGVAKFFRIKVEEFGLGLPPRAWSKKIGETVVSLNFLPLGGFVKLLGEQGEHENNPRSFAAAGFFPKIAVLSAGVIMNFIIAWVIFSGLIFSQGIKPFPLLIEQVEPDSPAAAVGLKEHDIVKNIGGVENPTVGQFVFISKSNANKPLEITVERITNEASQIAEPFTYTITPRQPEEGKGAIGVGLVRVGSMSGQLADLLKIEHPLAPGNFLESVGYGLAINVEAIQSTLLSFGDLVMHLLRVQIPNNIAGPVGIIQLTGRQAQLGILQLLFFTSVLSTNLAVLNIMPFPALDGGRIALLALEKIIQKKVPQHVEALIHTTGFALLLCLIAVVTFQDIGRIFGGR